MDLPLAASLAQIDDLVSQVTQWYDSNIVLNTQRTDAYQLEMSEVSRTVIPRVPTLRSSLLPAGF